VSEPASGSGGAPPGTRVLVVDDEAPIRRFLRTALEPHGFDVFEAANGRDALVEAGTRKPDLVILDLGLPDVDGADVLRRLREWSRMPVIVLSARANERDKVDALDAGADDYLTKPFGVGELLARMRVALRHAIAAGGTPGGEVYAVADLKVDLAARRVFVRGDEAHLTPLEYRLLAALVRQAGKVLTHRQLLTEVWGPPYVEHTHYLRIYMAGLRRKLEADPARPRYLLTETGVGYRLAAE